MTRSHKSTQGSKISFWESVRRKISVNNKMNDFVGNILQKRFNAYCYTLLSCTRRCTPICGAAVLLRCNWCRNLAAVNCILHWIVLALSTLHTLNSSSITLLWLSYTTITKCPYATTKTDVSSQVVLIHKHITLFWIPSISVTRAASAALHTPNWGATLLQRTHKSELKPPKQNLNPQI